jgi:hypothetical protein
MRKLKQLGFSDIQIGKMTGDDETTVRSTRKALGVKPSMKQIDVSTTGSSLEHRDSMALDSKPKKNHSQVFCFNQKSPCIASYF